MPDSTETKPAVVTPPAAPEQKSAETPQDPVKAGLLSGILGLVKPQDKVVTPPEPKKEETPAPAPVAKKEEPVAPAKKVVVKQKPAAPVAPPVEEIVEKSVQRALAAQPKPVVPELTPEPLPDLTDDQREELEIAEYAEKKDPTKKGIKDKYLKFFKDEKAFLAQQIEKEGEDYDPTTDPKYKKFIEANEPKLSRAEKKKLFAEKIAEEAEERGAKKAEERISPRLKQLEQKEKERDELPKVRARVGQFVNEVADGMPAELKEYFEKNGRDMAKLQEAYPTEFEIVSRHVDGAAKLASEMLALRAGIRTFDPENKDHAFLNSFVNGQADVFAKSGSDLLVRDGKRFIPPAQMRPGMEATHWTFDNEDVLELLKAQAQRDAKTVIEKKRLELELANKAAARRAAAPTSVVPTPPAEASPRTPAAPMPGAATPAGKTPGFLSGILKL